MCWNSGPRGRGQASVFGVAVFVIWVAPDVLIPGWRSSILFQNPLTGKLISSMTADVLGDPLSLALRTLRAVLIVPIVEELFWRGWLMRWIERPDFEAVPLGHYHRRSFWLVAILFALEHGPYLGCGTYRRRGLQLVDGPERAPQRPDPGSRCNQRLPLRIRNSDGPVANTGFEARELKHKRFP